MPNWCENRVHIYCDDPKVMQAFQKAFMPKGYFDFTLIMPLDKYTNDNCHENWGTKWNLVDEDKDGFDLDPRFIDANFETAWAPPEGIYRAIDEWFAENTKNINDYSITWFYDEPGMQFAGYLNNE